MHATLPTDSLDGLDAIPADVIVEVDGGRVVERKTGRMLLDVKRTLDSRMPAGVQGCPPILGRRELALETMTTRWSYLSHPLSLI
jgi:hypothetical protein